MYILYTTRVAGIISLFPTFLFSFSFVLVLVLFSFSDLIFFCASFCFSQSVILFFLRSLFHRMAIHFYVMWDLTKTNSPLFSSDFPRHTAEDIQLLDEIPMMSDPTVCQAASLWGKSTIRSHIFQFSFSQLQVSVCVCVCECAGVPLRAAEDVEAMAAATQGIPEN